MNEAFRAYHSAHLALVHYDRRGEPWLDQFRICPVYDEHGRPSGHFVGVSAAAPVRATLGALSAPPCAGGAPSRWMQPELLGMLDEQLNGKGPRPLLRGCPPSHSPAPSVPVGPLPPFPFARFLIPRSPAPSTPQPACVNAEGLSDRRRRRRAAAAAGLRWTPFFLVDTALARPRIVWASPAMEALTGFAPKVRPPARTSLAAGCHARRRRARANRRPPGSRSSPTSGAAAPRRG